MMKQENCMTSREADKLLLHDLDTMFLDSVSAFVPDAALPPPSMAAYLAHPWARALPPSLAVGREELKNSTNTPMVWLTGALWHRKSLCFANI
jgi:hypothetical protein